MKSGASIYSTEIYASSIGFYSTKNRKIRNLFRIFLTDATFSDFWRLIFQNHFKDTPREAAAAKPQLLLFFWGLFSPRVSRFFCTGPLLPKDHPQSPAPIFRQPNARDFDVPRYVSQ